MSHEEREIKFCPFCGAQLEYADYDLGQAVQAYPTCPTCKIGFYHRDSETIILLFPRERLRQT